MPFSGKSEAVAIAKEQGLPVIRMGDMVWKEVKKQKLPLNSETVGRIAKEMREIYGKDYWARKTIEQVKQNDDSKLIVIDGIRNREEISRFRNDLSQQFVVIAITVSKDVRYQRALARGRVDDPDDIKKIEERDEREEGWGVREVIDSADIQIKNDEDLESFREKVNEILNRERLMQ